MTAGVSRRGPRARMRRGIPFAGAAICAMIAGVGLVGAQRLTVSHAPEGVERITAVQLESFLSFIASDEMEGRATPSRGLDATARYLASHLARWQLGAPTGEDYAQRFPLTRRFVTSDATALRLAGRAFVYGEDFVAAPVEGSVEGTLVFVGHGFVVPAKHIDPYAGLDIAGKVIVVQMGLPNAIAARDLRGTLGEEYDTPEHYAARHGAIGVVRVPNFATLAVWNRIATQSTARGQLALERPSDQHDSLPTLTANASVLQVLFNNERHSANDVLGAALQGATLESFALSPNKRISFTVATRTERVPTQNVVAVLEGGDPALRHEYVAIGAHYDHLGTTTVDPDDAPPAAPDADSPPESEAGDDRIFNGADDDGSGTAAVLAMAEAFAGLPTRPRRSLLFVWHAGEETGLLGSEWFTEHPPVPLEHIVAQLNIDMIGRSRAVGDTSAENAGLTGPHGLHVIGSRMMSSALGALNDRVNREYLDLAFDYRYDDPDDPNRLFFRSDHYNYARKGIPVIFYFSGLHADYHTPKDEIDAIDFGKMERVTRTIYATALALANAPVRPRVDRPLPKEFTTR